MDRDDLELFERTVRNAAENGSDAAFDAALDTLGWSDALELDPHAAVSVLFEVQGATGVTSSALDRVVLDALDVDATGDSPGVVLPALGRWTPPGEIRDGRLTVAGLATAGSADREQAVVIARADGTDAAYTVATAALSLRPVHGVDPTLGLVTVHGETIEIGAPAAGTPPWDAAVAAAQVALGHELIGASRTMLALAREHALARIQFGRPISQFQAVRHRLAETLIAIETAAAGVEAAWLDRSPGTAAMAKALAGRGARVATKHCQQVLAGVGFTTEHDLHRYIRRVLVLDELLGSSRALTRSLGEELLTTRQLPRLLPL